MSLTEQERSKLYQDLEGVIGSESAGNLMSHLPPVGWADLATKRDVDHLGESLRSEMGVLRSEMAVLRSDLKGEIHMRMNAQTKSLFFSVAGLNLTIAGLVFAALRFT